MFINMFAFDLNLCYTGFKSLRLRESHTASLWVINLHFPDQINKYFCFLSLILNSHRWFDECVQNSESVVCFKIVTIPGFP